MLRIIAIVLLCFIVVNLFAGLYHIMRNRKEDPTRAARALTLRVVLSVLLFVFVVVLATSGILPQ